MKRLEEEVDANNYNDSHEDTIYYGTTLVIQWRTIKPIKNNMPTSILMAHRMHTCREHISHPTDPSHSLLHARIRLLFITHSDFHTFN